MSTTNTNAARELTLTRVINAPREMVFEMFTDPEHVKHWWGPVGFTNSIYNMDVKPGGKWDYTMHGPDGTDYENHNVFVEIVKPEKIVMDHVSGPKFTMSITFEAQGGQTLLSINMLFADAEQRAKVVEQFKADVGLKQNIDKLESYLDKSRQPFVIERTYNAPVETVWQAISEKDVMKQWYFDLAAFEARPGFEFTFDGGPDGRLYTHLCKVREVIVNKRLSYTWRYKGYDGNSLVTFDLFAEGDKTRLVLTHDGLESFHGEQYPDLKKENFVQGWTHLIGKALPEFLEKK